MAPKNPITINEAKELAGALVDQLSGKWRLVCHECGGKYPVGEAIPVFAADCCKKPKLHVHSLERPCEFCKEQGDQE